MAVAFVVRTYANSGTNTATVTVGTVPDGNIVYAVAWTGGTGSAAITAPGGWTTIDTGTFASDSARFGLFRIVASSLPTTAAFTSSDATSMNAYCMEFSGGDGTTPEDATTVRNTGTTSTLTWGSITTVTDNAMICAPIVGRSDACSSANMPSGYTTMSTDGNPQARGSYKTKTTAGSETLTAGGTQAIGSWVSYTIAIRESGAGAATGQPTMRRFGGVPGMGQGQTFGRSW